MTEDSTAMLLATQNKDGDALLPATQTASLQTQLGALAQGVIPDDLQTLSALTKDIINANGTLVQALAVVVTKTAERMGDNKAWLDLCKSDYGLSGNYLCHLRQVGTLLLSLAENGGDVPLQHYRRIFQLPYNKLITLARIPIRELPDFLRANRSIETLSRDELRATINSWQGKQKTGRQPMLPGLDKFMAYVDRNEDKLEAIFTAAAATPEKAQMCVLTGFRLVAGALATYKQRPAEHLEELTQLHADLTEELADLERAIAAAHENL